MQLVTVRTTTGTRAARLEGDEVVELDHADVGALLASGPGWREESEHADGLRRPLAESHLAPPVIRPEKIFCVGLNYETHIREMGRDIPEAPTLFAKFASALIGPTEPIAMSPVAAKVDWEAELALVIGEPARYVGEADARRHIAGYTVMNDVSMRDWQNRTGQFLQGKTFERSTPIGPGLVTLDDRDPEGLAIRCEVDGAVMQDSRTSDLIFGPAALVSYISHICTLMPGDIIATGTPGGVGAGRDPQVFLQPGQVLVTEVEGVGRLENPCVAEADLPPAHLGDHAW